MTNLFGMTNDSWKKYSLWGESSVTAGDYHRVSPDLAYMKTLPVKDLLWRYSVKTLTGTSFILAQIFKKTA